MFFSLLFVRIPVVLHGDTSFLFLFSELYAAREKVGVYIPKERYYEEENERKVIVLILLKLY